MNPTSTNDQNPQRLGAFRSANKSMVTKANRFLLNPSVIEIEEGFNIRNESAPSYEAHIAALTDAYLNDRYVPPITVTMKNGKPTVVDGHSRLKALRRAIEQGKKIDRIPVDEFTGEELGRELTLINANAGRPLSATEQATVYHRLHHNKGYTIKEIAENVGKTPSHISQRIELYSLPVKLKQLIDEDRVTLTLALDEFRKHGTQALEIIERKLAKMEKDAEQTLDKDTEGKPPRKPSKLTKSKLSGHKRMPNVDRRFIDRSLVELANALVNDTSRVRHVKSQDRVDISFPSEEFLIFVDLIDRVRQHARSLAPPETTDDAQGEPPETAAQADDDPNAVSEERKQQLYEMLR